MGRNAKYEMRTESHSLDNLKSCNVRLMSLMVFFGAAYSYMSCQIVLFHLTKTAYL